MADLGGLHAIALGVNIGPKFGETQPRFGLQCVINGFN
jgi:hypothetical protein